MKTTVASYQKAIGLRALADLRPFVELVRDLRPSQLGGDLAQVRALAQRVDLLLMEFGLPPVLPMSWSDEEAQG